MIARGSMMLGLGCLPSLTGQIDLTDKFKDQIPTQVLREGIFDSIRSVARAPPRSAGRFPGRDKSRPHV